MVVDTQVTKLMRSTWGPPGSCRPQMGPCWPNEHCYQSITWINDVHFHAPAQPCLSGIHNMNWNSTNLSLWCPTWSALDNVQVKGAWREYFLEKNPMKSLETNNNKENIKRADIVWDITPSMWFKHVLTQFFPLWENMQWLTHCGSHIKRTNYMVIFIKQNPVEVY